MARARMRRPSAAVLAGFIAVSVHTVLLLAARAFDLQVGSGGLLGLLRNAWGDRFQALGIGRIWSGAGLPLPGSTAFWILFHVLVGILLALIYAWLFEPRLKGSGQRRGVLFAQLPWILHSAVLMPLVGNGFAGYHVLPLVGIAWFFVANAVYGALLGFCYGRFRLLSRSAWS